MPRQLGQLVWWWEGKWCYYCGTIQWNLTVTCSLALELNLVTVDRKKYEPAPSGRSLRSSLAWQNKLLASGSRAVSPYCPTMKEEHFASKVLASGDAASHTNMGKTVKVWIQTGLNSHWKCISIPFLLFSRRNLNPEIPLSPKVPLMHYRTICSNHLFLKPHTHGCLQDVAAYLSFTGDCYPPLTPVRADRLRNCLLCVLFRYPVKYLQVIEKCCHKKFEEQKYGGIPNIYFQLGSELQKTSLPCVLDLKSVYSSLFSLPSSIR